VRATCCNRCLPSIYIVQMQPMQDGSNMEKNPRHIIRHRVAFEDAQGIFDRATVEKAVDRFDYGASRVHAMDLVNGRAIAVG
jgi:uncharacterized DUF497 family protein